MDFRDWFRNVPLRAFAGLVAFAFATGAVAQTAPPTYSGFQQSILLPYAHKTDWDHLDKTLEVQASVNGGPVGAFTVDTGSVGMIVSAHDVPHIDPNAPEGSIYYNSSGVELHGVWTKATVTFPDAKGGVAVAVIPVLAVTSRACTGRGVNAARCQPTDDPHPHMLGIGFGRAEEGHPEKNAFLNLREMAAGTMRRGYVIGPDGIRLGLTAAGAKGFVWQKLSPNPMSREALVYGASLKDWEMASGSFAVKDAESEPGMVLMDTGLTNMILEQPGRENKGDVPDGTQVTIDLLGGQLHYSFVVGDEKNPQTPRRVSWVRATHGTFVNTGLHALAGYEYLYDADGGWLALRPLKR
jgi:hypothetical protein